MQPGEQKTFIQYLHQQKLHIDMWDGDSLLPIGSTVVTLKHLLRQGHPAVQVSQQLDISSVDYADDKPMLTNDSVQCGQPYPSGVKINHKGKLYFRMVNVGYIPDKNSEKMNSLTSSLKSTVVQPKMCGTLTSSSVSSTHPLKSSAKLMTDCDTELATALLSRKDLTGKSPKMKDQEMNMKRKRFVC